MLRAGRHRYDWSGFGSMKDYGFLSDPYSRYELSSVPIVGDFMRASDNKKYWNDYFANTGMSWNDVKYPALMSGQRAIGAGVNVGYSAAGAMVSRNLLRLYK